MVRMSDCHSPSIVLIYNNKKDDNVEEILENVILVINLVFHTIMILLVSICLYTVLVKANQVNPHFNYLNRWSFVD